MSSLSSVEATFRNLGSSSLAVVQPHQAESVRVRQHMQFTLSANLDVSLAQFCKQHDLSTFSTLLALFHILIAQRTDRPASVIGVPYTLGPTRANPPTAHYLPVHASIAEQDSMQTVLLSVQQWLEQLDADEESLRQRLHAAHASCAILFGARPSFIEARGGTLGRWQQTDADHADQVELCVWLGRDDARQLTVAFDYLAPLLTATTVENIWDHYATLLNALLSNPHQRVVELPRLGRVERRRLIEAGNQTTTPFHDDVCFHHLFEQQARQRPDAPAIMFGDQTLTYQQLNKRANQLAYHLMQRGVTVETLVGLCIERSPEMIIAILGIMKAGGAYVPLDPTYPTERLHYLVEDARLNVLVTQASVIDKLPPVRAERVLMDAHHAQIAAHAIDNPNGPVTADNLAYVIYTSGSTGRPKGAQIAHRGLCNLADAQTEQFDLTPDLRILQFSSLNFDASIFEIVMALRVGATLCLATLDEIKPGPDFSTFVNERGITNVTIPPFVLSLVPDATAPTLQTIVVAGEACPPEIVTKWAPGRRFFNAYGPTETTVWATVARCEGGGRPPIGRPINNVRVYALDEHLRPVATGVPGELFIAGEGLARGYLRRPGLTADRFRPDPFSGVIGARMYRTGDVVRYREDGQLDFIERIDTQVKLRGIRVELGEIEAVLGEHPAIREVVVQTASTSAQQPQLVAYIVPHQHTTVDLSNLRHHVQSRLPEYMVPNAFVPLSHFPLTPNGKVDRHALPAVEQANRLQVKSTFVEPQTASEKAVAEIWRELFDKPRVGIHDNFFELGGHSLLAIQFVIRFRERFGVELPLEVVFRQPTIAMIAEAVTQDVSFSRITTMEPPPLVKMTTGNGPFPLSFSQERIWFINQMDPDNKAYNTQLKLEFKGDLKYDILEQALTEIVRRHQVLRTTFPADGGLPVQMVHPPYAVRLPVEDLSSLSETEQQTAIHEWFQFEIDRIFNVNELPLIQWRLLKLTHNHHILIQVEYHFVHDGWSLANLLDELRVLYTAYVQGGPSPLDELPIQFADFAVWQRQWVQGDYLNALENYWIQKLTNMPELLQLPMTRPRPRIQGHDGVVLWQTFSKAQYQQMKAFGHRQGLTLFMTMYMAFILLLQKYTGEEDIAVGTGVANRSVKESELLIGMIINTLVLRLKLSDDAEIQQLADQVRKTCLEALAHQDMPFSKLVDLLKPERSVSYSPLFQVSFSFHDSPIPDLQLPNLTGEIHYGSNQSSKCDLNVITIPRVEQLFASREGTEFDRLMVAWEYNTGLFDQAAIERMMRHYEMVLMQLVASRPDMPTSQLKMLSDAETFQMTQTWNETTAPRPEEKRLHRLFEQVAAASPDAVALVQYDEQITYRALNERANQLAHYLQTLGVGTEDFVGLCVERSIDMIVGLLAILKAGGTYIPLDPTYPAQRLAYILEDAGADYLITHAHLTSLTETTARHRIVLDGVGPIVQTYPKENPASGASAQTLAYAIYTSGSTGRPKGVMIAHESVGNVIASSIKQLKEREQNRILQLASLSFDASVLEIFTALLSGGSLYLLNRHDVLAVDQLVNNIAAWEINAIAIPPSLLEVLPHRELPHLDTIIVGGETCSANTANKWAQGRAFYNAYAPTEATIYCTLMPCQGPFVMSPPVGYPIENTQIYILDKNLQPVPIGVTGQLYISGVGVARGYLNRPKQTADTFLPNPFADRPGTRMYKTGDLARFDADGTIEFVGRADHQIKLRGFRIELGEIEAVLNQHKRVDECVVMMHADEVGTKRLIAYVVPKWRKSVTVEGLRHFLRDRLPDYMIPAHFHLMEAFPLTAHGKIDRELLPQPQGERLNLDGQLVEPRNGLERKLRDVWTSVLGVDKIGVYDNYFALGGDSILSIQIVSRARKLGIHLSTKTMFEHQTIADLATAINTSAAVVAEQAPVSGSVPLTPIQQWFFEQELPNPHYWNQSVLLEAHQLLDPALVRETLARLLHHHDALRLRFSQASTGWQQTNQLPDAAVPFVSVDLQAVSPKEQKAAAFEQMLALQQTIHIEDGPLLQAALFNLGPDKPQWLFLTIHHLAVDNVSWQIVLEDFQSVYLALADNQDADEGRAAHQIWLPPKTTSFKRWAEGLREAAADMGADEIAYWRSLTENETAAMPVDNPNGANDEASAHIFTSTLTKAETDALRHTAPTAYGTTILTLLLTALTRTCTSGGQTAIQIDLEGHGREAISDKLDVSRTVGWFTSIYPVQLQQGSVGTLHDDIACVDQQLHAIPRKGVGYGLLRYLSPTAAVATQPLSMPSSPISFNYLGQMDRAFAQLHMFTLVDQLSEMTHSPEGARRYLLDVKAVIKDGVLHIAWKYSANLFTAASIERLAQSYMETLQQMLVEGPMAQANENGGVYFPDSGLSPDELQALIAQL